jgi:hypothetical protein
MVEFALIAPMFFIILFAIIEGARFVFYNEMLNNATREGARYAIVHGANTFDTCRSGPTPGGVTPCDIEGEDVREAVRTAAISLISTGDLSIPKPVWTPAGSALPPDGAAGGSASPGNNSRGSYVTVFVNYTYSPLIPILPSITISARSSLVINN